MLLQKSLQQDVIKSVNESLTFKIFYQRIRPDISPFIAATENLPLTNLNDWERLIRWQISSSLQTYSSPKGKIDSYLIGSLGWLDLCNSDGFRRERALRILSGGAPSRFLMALVVRKLNDWVPEVRSAACDILPCVADYSDPEIIVDVLFETLPYWNSWGRMGVAEKNTLMNIVSMGKVAASLKNRLISSTSGPVANIFSQVSRTEVLDCFLSEIAERSIQPSLRAKAYRCLLENKVVWAEGTTWKWIDKAYCLRRSVPVLNERTLSVERPFIEILRMAVIDHSPMVRRIAGEMLIKHLDSIGVYAFDLAKTLASDLSSSVAERGKYALADLDKKREAR